MTASDLLGIWLTETHDRDVDRYRPSISQFQAWLDFYGEDIAPVGVRAGTRGYIVKYGCVTSSAQQDHMINYINVVLRDKQKERTLRKKRIARRAAKKAANGIS